MKINKEILAHLLSSNENRILQAEMLALTHDIDLDEFIKDLGYNDIGIVKPYDFMTNELSIKNDGVQQCIKIPNGVKK